MSSKINYPPEEILKPRLGVKPDKEFIILWMLNNNEACTWDNLCHVVKRSTLSVYKSKLIDKGFIEYERNNYRITPEGRKRYYELSQAKSEKRRVSYPPKIILHQRNYDDWILWMVYNNNFCSWADFRLEDSPVRINQSSLSKNMNDLIEKGLIIRENKEYRISQRGKLEYPNMLRKYDLDRQSILEQEGRRIKGITRSTIEFFRKYKVIDNQLRYLVLFNALKLPYERVRDDIDQEDFFKVLLFISMNHPNFYPNYILTEKFSKKYNVERVVLEYHVHQIMELKKPNNKRLYPIKFFKLEVGDGMYYFQVGEKLEKMLNAIVEDYISQFTYLNKLFEEAPYEISSLTMESTLNLILDEITGSIFAKGLRNSLEQFLPDYINYLAFKIEKKRKLIDSYDKSEALIWQQVQISSQMQQNGNKKVIYYMEPKLLEVLEHYINPKLMPIFHEAKKFMEVQDYTKALESIASFADLDQKDIELNLIKSMLLCYLDRYEEATKVLPTTKAINARKEENLNLTSYFIKSYAYISLGKIDLAFKIAQNAVKTHQNHPLSYGIKGFVHGYNSMFMIKPNIAKKENGLELLDRAIELETLNLNKARYHQLKSNVYLELNKTDNVDALDEINKALELSPDKPDIYHTKNKILVYYDQYEETLENLDQMLKLFPGLERDLKMKKADVHKKMKQPEIGLKLIDELLEKYPDDNELLNYKALWYQYLNQKDEALRAIQDLIIKEPNIGIHHDTYGEILMAFQDYDNAKHEFQKTLELAPDEWYLFQTHIKLGTCYKELEDFDSAIEHLNKGKEMTTDCACSVPLKDRWLQIANLFLEEIELMEF